jgi:hypothetical protein
MDVHPLDSWVEDTAFALGGRSQAISLALAARGWLQAGRWIFDTLPGS